MYDHFLAYTVLALSNKMNKKVFGEENENKLINTSL